MWPVALQRLRRSLRAAWRYGWDSAVRETLAAAGFSLGGPVIVLLSYRFLQEHATLLAAIQFVSLGLLIQALIGFSKSLVAAARTVLCRWRVGFRALLGKKVQSSTEPSTGQGSAWGLRFYLFGTGLWLSLLLLLGLFYFSERRQEEKLEDVEGLEVGRDIAPLAATVFFPEEAKFEAWAEGCAVNGLEEGLSSRDELKLERLMNVYDQCGSAEAPVQVEVRGFASSSVLGVPDNGKPSHEMCPAWRECLERQRCEDASSPERMQCLSAAFNLCVAERRADHVRAWLEASPARSEGVHLVGRQWRSYDEMAGRQPVVDRFDGSYNLDFGAINRRVEVIMLGGGSCRLVRAVEDERPRQEWIVDMKEKMDRGFGRDGVLWCWSRSLRAAAAGAVRRVGWSDQ